MLWRRTLRSTTNLDVGLASGPLTLYASPKILSALNELTNDMMLYKGVRLAEVMQAVYEQGLMDGRRDVIERFATIQKTMKYLPPGQPKKKK